MDETGEVSQIYLSTHTVRMAHLLILMMWPSSTFLSFIDLYASRVQMDKARTFTWKRGGGQEKMKNKKETMD